MMAELWQCQGHLCDAKPGRCCDRPRAGQRSPWEAGNLDASACEWSDMARACPPMLARAGLGGGARNRRSRPGLFRTDSLAKRVPVPGDGCPPAAAT
jgi:hypothetical protein